MAGWAEGYGPFGGYVGSRGRFQLSRSVPTFDGRPCLAVTEAVLREWQGHSPLLGVLEGQFHGPGRRPAHGVMQFGFRHTGLLEQPVSVAVHELDHKRCGFV